MPSLEARSRQRFIAVLEPVIAQVQAFAAANPQLVTTIGSIAAALIGANIALIGVKYAGLLMGGQVLALASGLLKLIRPIEMVKEAMNLLKLAVIGTGIGAILVGIALAGTCIYNNWSGIVTAFKAFGDEITTRFPGLGPIVQKVGEFISTLFEGLGNLTGKISASSEVWAAFGTSIANAIANGYEAGSGTAPASDAMGGATMGDMPSKARGGPVAGGRPYLVGERGPGIFTPGGGGILARRPANGPRVRAVQGEAIKVIKLEGTSIQ